MNILTIDQVIGLNQFCEGCGKVLIGKQTKWCSQECENKYSNALHQNYRAQQLRGWERKKELIKLFGGCCPRCGYNKNVSALEFHHRDPSKKKFTLDIRHLSNRRMQVVIEEAKKCDLICANCHREEHNPEGLM